MSLQTLARVLDLTSVRESEVLASLATIGRGRGGVEGNCNRCSEIVRAYSLLFMSVRAICLLVIKKCIEYTGVALQTENCFLMIMVSCLLILHVDMVLL